jgi:hypothetical protein
MGAARPPRGAGGGTVRYAAPDFPTAYRVTQLITMLGGI